MIILVQPMYSKQELNADSNYVVYTALIRAMAKHRPDWSWVVIFPDANSGYKYDDDGFFNLPNVTRIPQRISPRKLANAVSFDGGWYDQLFRAIGIDAVWCNLVEIAPAIKASGVGSYTDSGRQGIVCAHNYVMHKSLPYPIASLQAPLIAQLAGGIAADVNVFNSDHCQNMFLDNCREYLSPAMVDQIKGTSTRIDYGTLEPELVPVETRNEVPIIAYNHRLQSYKNFADTFRLLGELYSAGLRFKVRYMNNTAEMTAKIRSYPFVELKLCATRTDYLKELRGCDLNVTNSQHETFCIAAVESMALGQPLVAPNGITFPEITGRAKNKYPYLFKGPQDQKTMIMKLIEDAKERKKWGKILSEHVRASYGCALWAERYAAVFEPFGTHDFSTSAPDAVAMARAALVKHSGCTTREYYQEIADVKVGEGKTRRVPFSNQSMPFTKLVRFVRHMGGRVAMVNGQQRVFAK